MYRVGPLWCQGESCRNCNTGSNTEHGHSSAEKLWFPKIPTLSPSIHCETEGAEEFDSPKQYDSLECRGEIRDLAGQLSPTQKPSRQCQTYAFSLRVHSASKDEGHSMGHRTPLPPACPLPTVCSQCLEQLGREGTLGWRYWCQGGPSSYNSPQDTGGCCIQRAVWGFPSPRYTLLFL